MSSATASRPGRTLPVILTGFVGRTDVIGAVIEILERPDTRLLTLTGPAGIGKSRLAIEVAQRCARTSFENVAFVPLAPLDDPEDVLPAIADRLGLWDAEGGDLLSRIASLVRDDPALLVLDNFEHVVPAATAVKELLGACPGLVTLTTSRVPLHVEGEREYSVPQLELTDPAHSISVEELLENEAIQLFVQRAQAVKQDFDVDLDSLRLVAEICSRLEGLPLAIELAAARTKVLPLPALCQRLQNQLQILRSDSRDIPPRLRTMNSAIAWSYDLLDEDERRLFRLLSIFRTLFQLDGAAALAGLDEVDALDGIYSLVDKSILSLRASSEGEPAYRMLQVIRQFGLMKLEEAGELEFARKRHAEYFAGLAEQAFADYFGSGQAESSAQLEQFHDDLRAALSWSISAGEFETAARLGSSLWVYWHMRCHLGEGRRWLNQLIAIRDRIPDDHLPRILFGAGVLATSQRDFETVGDLGRMLQEIADQTEDKLVTGFAFYLAGSASGHESPEASRHYAQAVESWRDIDGGKWVWYALSQVGLSALESGDLETAFVETREAYEHCRQINHPWAISLTGSYLGRVYRHLDKPDEALSHLNEALMLATQTGDRVLTPTILEHIAGLAAAGPHSESSARLFGHAALIRETRSFPSKPMDVELHSEAMQSARKRIGDQAFRDAWAAGRRMPLDSVIAEALAIDDAGTHAPVSEPATASIITRREREVLRLVVKGYSDQQIADELFVSYRTVTTHVTHILNKLGAGSRTEAAAIAVRTGLVSE